MAEIGYEGALNLEIGGYLKHSTREIQNALLNSAKASVSRLRTMFDEARN